MRKHYIVPNIGIGADHNTVNASHSKLSKKLGEMGLTYGHVLGFLKDQGLLDISMDRMTYRMNGDAMISDIELIMWSKLLRCTVEELVSQFKVDPKLDAISDKLFNLAKIKKEIDSLYPVVKWHPKKPDISLLRVDRHNVHSVGKNIVWNALSNEQLWAFYMEYGTHLTICEYTEIAPHKIRNKISQLRKHHHDQLDQLVYDNNTTPSGNFVKYHDSFGTNATAERYGISIEKVEEYAQVVHYLNSIKID